ncbi:uncharacterized protein LOC131664333 isoform X2 [Phymastichus coffea]|nr:uncharacterized protein LOC131664333 isoform X2 [Phymastichus coffea]
MEAIKEAADQDLLTNLLLQSEGKKNNIVNPVHTPNEVDVNNDQFSTYGLTQSCRDFIAKKLVEKLNVDIVLKDAIKLNNIKENISRKPSGIKLFNCSNTILTEIFDDDKQNKIDRKNVSKAFDEKTNLSRCKEVAIDSQAILSQDDLKFWVNRKHSQEFKYKKLKSGTLLQIE